MTALTVIVVNWNTQALLVSLSVVGYRLPLPKCAAG